MSNYIKSKLFALKFWFCETFGKRITKRKRSKHHPNTWKSRRGWELPNGTIIWYDNDYNKSN
jgi:hypothetical protein